jgi:hypothetical protein
MARSAGAHSAEPTAQFPGIFVIVALGLLRLGLLLATLGLAGGALAALLGFVVPALDLFNHFQAVLLAGLIIVLIAVPLCFIGQRGDRAGRFRLDDRAGNCRRPRATHGAPD